jgi:peptide/nickel transport system ATP-binding protein
MAEQVAEIPVLEAIHVSRNFDVSKAWLQRVLAGEGKLTLRAVDDLSFAIPRGTTLSLVGESGCGKSTVARMAVGLYAPSSGEMLFEGQPLSAARAQAGLRRRMNMIFQDPYASLNPRWRVRDIVAEPIRAFALIRNERDIVGRVGQLLTQVGLAPADGEKFPHEFSGGQRQRISIARALSSEPEFLVCDEPTSALDVSVQAQILNLLAELQRDLGLTYLFISHNLAVIEHIASEVAVMYLGRFVEQAQVDMLFREPRHPYTRALLSSVLTPEPGKGIPDVGLGESYPDPANIPPGCRFHPRCPLAVDRCRSEPPEGIVREGRLTECLLV